MRQRYRTAISHQFARELRGRRGIALLSVLLMLTLLSLIAANFAHTSRGDINLARNLIDNARADALAQAAIERSILGLRESQVDKIWRSDSAVYAWHYKGAELRVLIEDEGGRIDVNAADPKLLIALFESLQDEEGAALVDSRDAAQLGHAIADFIDEDDDRRRDGAEKPDYNDAEIPFGPRNAPLAAVSDLRQVLGMTPHLYRRIEPALTVFTGMAVPHAPSAGMLAQEALKEYADRSGQGIQDTSPPRPIPGEEAFSDLTAEPRLIGQEAELVPRSNVRIFRFHAEAKLSNQTVFAREAVVDLRSDPARILSWIPTTRRLFARFSHSEE